MSEENKFQFVVKVPGVEELGKATGAAIDLGVEASKGFLKAVCKRPAEQLGLLLEDKMAFIRFKNAVRTLSKAKDYCELHNIKLKELPPKILVPLLDYASMEEEDYMQDKWATMLGNMVDSEQNIQNHVFPYLLSQMSTHEFEIIEKVYSDKVKRVIIGRQRLDEYRSTYQETNKILVEKLNTNEYEINNYRHNADRSKFKHLGELFDLKSKISKEIFEHDFKENLILHQINGPAVIDEVELLSFEFENLKRLGIVAKIQETTSSEQLIEIPNDPELSYLRVEFTPDITTTNELIITALGELLLQACNEK